MTKINIDDKYTQTLDPDLLLQGINAAIRAARPALETGLDIMLAMTAEQETRYDHARACENEVWRQIGELRQQIEILLTQVAFWKAKQEAIEQEVLDEWK